MKHAPEIRRLNWCLVIGAWCFALLLTSACTSATRPQGEARPLPPPQAAAVATAQEQKDATITAQAAQIDTVAPAAAPHTAQIREAIAAAPAAEVTKLVADYRAHDTATAATIATLRTQAATLTTKLAAAENATHRTILLTAYALVALLLIAGISTYFLAARLPFLGPWIGHALCASSLALLILLQLYDYLYRHPAWLLLPGLGILIAITLAIANHRHETLARTPA